MVIAPLPSVLVPRDTSPKMWGWLGRSSAVSSMQMMRCRWLTSPSRAANNVVLPLPVPPMTRKERRAATNCCKHVFVGSDIVPRSHKVSRLVTAWRSTRNEIHVPPCAGGDKIACTRTLEPSSRDNCPSAKHCVSSSRRPADTKSRVANCRTSRSDANPISAASRPRPRSNHTPWVPFTSTSVTPGRESTCSNGPTPTESWRSFRNTDNTSTSLMMPPASARMVWAT